MASEYKISPNPTWVDPINISDPQEHSDTKDFGYVTLLVDKQTKVEQNQITYFTHIIEKVLKNDEIRSMSNFEIVFDPRQERVLLHKLCIKRGLQIINQLFPQNIRILQRERKLEENIYTGEKSLIIFLEDLRVGDSVEYAYTLERRDPRFINNFYANLYLNFSVPIFEHRYRLLWPKDRTLMIKNHKTKINPIINEEGNTKEYIWNVKGIKEQNSEESIPIWYNPHSRIEVGAKKSWHDIALEKSEIYKVPETISKDLKKYISNIDSQYKNKSDQLLNVVRFIQEDIRYMSVPIDDWLPTDPSLVFKRRYGNCRDKVLLALTILKGLGIKAVPVLVHTETGKILNESIPHLSAFDHIIILATMDEKPYYFDLTASFQRGSLENFSQPNYGYVLVLDANTTELSEITSPLSQLSFRAVYETIDLSKGFDKPASLSVKTFVKGKAADLTREMFSSAKIEDKQKEYLTYYKKFYPSLVLKDDLKITDDVEKNEITFVESYEIQEPTVLEADKKNLTFTHHADEFFSFMPHNDLLSPRTMPLSITHPIHAFKHVDILLPEEGPEAKNAELKDSSFYFNKRESSENNRFSVTYTYMAFKDHVNPQDMPRYIENIKKMEDHLGGALSYPVEDYINWDRVFLALLILLILLYGGYKIYTFI